MKKLYIGVVMTVVMLFSNLSIARAESDSAILGSDILKDKIQQIEDMEADVRAMTESVQYNKSTTEFDNLMKNFEVNGEGYPSYYGGSYMTDDGDLVVLLTDESREIATEIQNYTQSTDVTIQYVDISLNQLKAVQESYGDKYVNLYAQKDITALFSDDERELLEDLSGTYIDQADNELVVKIRDITDEKIAICKRIFGEEPYIRYEKGGINVLNATEWRPGRYIYTTAQEPFSTGFRARYTDSNGNSFNGFVTAGHGCSATNVIYRAQSLSSSNILGICKVSKNSGKVDAAFVAISDANYTPSNTLSYPNDGSTLRTLASTSYATSVADNEWVYKCGGRTYSTVGKVINNAASFYLGVNITDLYQTNVLCLGGDSGGCAYVIRNGQCLAIGIVKGSDFDSSGVIDTQAAFMYSYFTKIKNILSTWNITKY